jgi:hypothetical protein
MKNNMLFTALAAVTVMLGGALEAEAGKQWVIKKATWSVADEKSYSNFIESIYASKCNTVDKCMKGTGNWYRDRDPAGMNWYADCGRFPYLMRAYFAFHNNLPFQGAADAAPRDPNDPNPVAKYSAHGTYITRRRAAQTGVDGYQFLQRVVNSAYTIVYRVDTRLDIPTGQFGDHYNVAINRSNIRPGTVVYDPNGHVAMVAKVGNDGKLTLLDSHPDNTVSRIPYTSAFQGSSAKQGGGLKNWRPIRVAGATVGASGELIGGQTLTATNAETPGYSLEQYVGDQPNPKGTFGAARWKTSDGILGARQYTDVVRARLSVGDVVYDPVKEIREGIAALCVMLQDRADSVTAAIKENIDQKQMPNGRLPLNIFGTDGEWETYSTPSRDARLKTAASEFRTLIEKILTLSRTDLSKISYTGTSLYNDMLKAHDSAAATCSLSYKKSNGDVHAVSYTDAIQRLYKMSFDPYHCVELRWGASSATELASCATNSGDKLAWYKAEQRLRNSHERRYDMKMGWSLDELTARADMGPTPAKSVGSDRQIPLDIRDPLLTAAGRIPGTPPAPAPGPVPEPTPVPVPTPAPTPSNENEPPPPTDKLCEGLYNGNLTKHGEAAQLQLSAFDMTLSVNDTAYHGEGQCQMVTARQAKFRFALDNDRNYVFAGVITLNVDGTVALKADELKHGKVIDQLIMTRLPVR